MKSRLLTAAVAAALLFPALAAAQQPGSHPELRAQIEALKAEIQKLDALKGQMASLEQRLIESEARAAAVDKAGAEVSQVSKDLAMVQDDVDDLDKRMTNPERHAVVDAIEWGGDFRFEAHSIQAEVPAHFDGMALQKGIVDTMFYFTRTGGPPMAPGAAQAEIQANYGQYLGFLDGLTYEGLGQFLQQFSPAQQQQLMGSLLPGTYVPAYSDDNSILYTSRLRLQMHAAVGKNVTFDGRLGMYKVWGDSTGVQVFNGSPTSISWDGTTVGVPNSDILRVERAYFTWSNIGGAPVYASIGRRPSTDGSPLNFRNDELRAGTPPGGLFNYQYDGITLGWHINDLSTARICYGVGYESGWGNGANLDPHNSLEDAQFVGILWDIIDRKDMFLQATVARAFNLSDGFNGLVVLPNDPLTGNAIKAPVVLRYTPSVTLGDVELASLVLTRRDGPIDWFVTGSYMRSHPTSATTPFGGLFTNPMQVPEDHSGSMFHLGGRYNFANGATKVGLEFNHGSEYWFNFALAEDDLMGAKTATRGDVWEVYLTHRIRDNFMVKLNYLDYSFDYSGSGWMLGAPQDLASGTPLLGFPTYDSIGQFKLSLTARF